MTIDLVNLLANADNYKVITFPKRIRVTEVSFSVNGEAAGSIEDERVWQLYFWGAHPTPSEGSPWDDWTFPVFDTGEGDYKPILSNATSEFVSSTKAPYNEIVSVPPQTFFKVDIDLGVFAPGDYAAIWIENTAGDVEEITWADTEATISIVYEETTKRSIYELTQQYPFLD